MKKLSLFLWWRTEEKGEKEEEARQKNKWTNKQNPTMHEWKHPSSSTHCENRLVHPCPNCPELDSRKEKLKMINCDMVKSDWRRDWGGPEIRWRVIEGEIEVAGLRPGEGLLKERLRWQAWDQVKREGEIGVAGWWVIEREIGESGLRSGMARRTAQDRKGLRNLLDTYLLLGMIKMSEWVMKPPVFERDKNQRNNPWKTHPHHWDEMLPSAPLTEESHSKDLLSSLPVQWGKWNACCGPSIFFTNRILGNPIPFSWED